MPTQAYYFTNPQFDPSRPRPRTLGDIVGNVMWMAGDVLAENIFGTITLYPALKKDSWARKFYGKLPGLRTILNDYETYIKTKVGEQLAQDVSGMPLNVWGRLDKAASKAYSVLRQNILGQGQPTLRNVIQATFRKSARKQLLSDLAELWQNKGTRAFLIGSVGLNLTVAWQSAQWWGLGITLGEMAFRGLASLGQLRKRYITARAMSGIMGVQTLSATPSSNLFGEELYYTQQNIQNHIMTRQLLDSGILENPYSIYRLI